MTNNFAVTNSIFEVASSGRMEIIDSQIYNNYAVEYVLGTIFLTVENSIFRNTQVHSNRQISKSDLTGEISGSCDKL